MTATARAQLDPAVYTSGTETNSRYNANSSATYGPDSVAYENCYVFASGGSHLRLNQLSVGIRRVGTAAAPAPATQHGAVTLEPLKRRCAVDLSGTRLRHSGSEFLSIEFLSENIKPKSGTNKL